MGHRTDSHSGGHDHRRGRIYPSPFFDVAQTYMPPTVKELFRWCKYFFYKDPMIGSVVTKIAEYPVTDFIYTADSKHVRDGWKAIFEDSLNMKSFLIEIGLDYFTYGNAFVSINWPFTRWIQCKECKERFKLEDDRFKFKFQSWNFIFDCGNCGHKGAGNIIDKPLKDKDGINFVRWDPANIDIHYNPITGKSRYRYKIPNKVKRGIYEGNREILTEIPQVFIEALKKRRDILLSSQNLFHFKRPTLAEMDMGWGKPLIIHSMSRMFYLYVLRRAQEAIALQRILPLEFIFPQGNQSQDPYQHVNLRQWAGTVQDEIRKWRQDPNYISVVPVPLGFERLGGDGRALLLGPEIEVTNKEITGGMGVPVEFVFGGLSWSGSSVSLRTLENHFLMYRTLLMRFINWVKNRIRIYLKLPDVQIGFTEFKMADDIQRKQLVVQLNAANKISDHTLLTELGFDYDEELKSIKSETEQRNQISAIMMKAQTEAQGESQILQAKYTAKAEEANVKARQSSDVLKEQDQQQMAMQQGMDPNAPQQAAPGGAPGGAPGAPQQGPQPGAQQQPGQGGDNIAADQQMAGASPGGTMGTQPGDGGEGSSGGQVIPMDARTIALQWANRIKKLDRFQQQQVLSDLQRKMPAMFRLVQQLLSQMGPGQTAAEGQQQNKPLPQMRPPKRTNGPV